MYIGLSFMVVETAMCHNGQYRVITRALISTVILVETPQMGPPALKRNMMNTVEGYNGCTIKVHDHQGNA